MKTYSRGSRREITLLALQFNLLSKGHVEGIQQYQKQNSIFKTDKSVVLLFEEGSDEILYDWAQHGEALGELQASFISFIKYK